MLSNVVLHLSVSFGLSFYCFKASEPSEQFHRQNSHTAAHSQSRAPSRSHSRATHSLGHRHPSSSTTVVIPTPTPSLQSTAQAQDPHLNVGRLDPGLTSTLEHIVGQLDILTQVSRIWVCSSFMVASIHSALLHCTLSTTPTPASTNTSPTLGTGWVEIFGFLTLETQKSHFVFLGWIFLPIVRTHISGKAHSGCFFNGSPSLSS